LPATADGKLLTGRIGPGTGGETVEHGYTARSCFDQFTGVSTLFCFFSRSLQNQSINQSINRNQQQQQQQLHGKHNFDFVPAMNVTSKSSSSNLKLQQ
jgi:hypothetical protein